MASVHRRVNKDGSVTPRVMFRVNGRQRQESFTDEKSAYEFARLVDKVGAPAALRVLEARQNADVGMPTLRQWTRHYLDESSGLLTGITPGTREGYRRIAERSFLPFLGDYPIDAIGKAEVGRWVAWQEKRPSARDASQPVAAKTVRNYHALLSNVLAAAVAEGKRAENPARGTRLSRGQRQESVFLTPEEFATVLAFIPERHVGLIMFLAGTGCRWGEATAVTWGDINLHAQPPTVRISKAWKKGATGAPELGHPKSSRANRTISLSSDVVHAIGKPALLSDALVFPSRSGGHLWYGRFRTSVWERAVEKARDSAACEPYGFTPISKNPTIHDLRHSHASWLIASGLPLTTIQRRLGHESIQTTSDTYGHLMPEALAQTASVIASIMSGVMPLRELEDADRT